MQQYFKFETTKLDVISLRKPTGQDGAKVHSLISKCPPLDQNSLYANVLQCTHFAETSIIAEMNSEVCGWISGYRMPDDPSTLFIWQVAVSEAARGRGVAKAMLKGLLAGANLPAIRYLKTTITKGNSASWSLFNSFAEDMLAETTSSLYFGRDTHLEGAHDSEHLLTIGPLDRKVAQKASYSLENLTV